MFLAHPAGPPARPVGRPRSQNRSLVARFTRSSIALAVVGVLLLVGAGLVRFVLVPSMSKLPSDFETSQDFEGTYTGLNPTALSGSPTGDVLLRDVPVTATRSYATDSVDGDTAVVTRTIERSIGGQADPPTETRYAVDRVDFESVDAPSVPRTSSPVTV